MTAGRKTSFKVGCVLLAGALVAWLLGENTVRRHRWGVLKEPIRIEEGFALTRSFTVDVPCEYIIEVECKKEVPVETLEAILKSELAVSYSVDEDGRALVEGDSAVWHGTSYRQRSISRHLAPFSARPGHTYRLNLRVTRSLPQLAATSPIVKVWRHTDGFEEGLWSGFDLFPRRHGIVDSWVGLHRGGDRLLAAPVLCEDCSASG